MSKKTIAIAFVGSAPVRPLAIRSALNDWLGFGEPDADGLFEESAKYDVSLLFPAGPDHWNPALEEVWKWSAMANLEYDLVLDKHGKDDDSLEFVVEDAEQVIEVTNVSKALVDNLDKTDADEKFIVALWGEEGDDEADSVLTFSEAAGIPAKDLSAALDDLVYGDPEEDEPEVQPEPDPEPVPEERPRRGRRGAKAEEKAEEPAAEEAPRRRRGAKPEPVAEEQALDEDEETLDDEPVAAPEPVKEEKPKTTRKAKEKAPEPEPVKDEPVAEEKSWGEAGAGHVAKADIPPVVWEALQKARRYIDHIDVGTAIKNDAAETISSPLALLLGKALSALENIQNGEPTTTEPVSVEENAEEPKRRGRPRTKAEVFPYLHNEAEGTYRKAGRGRPRRGETRVELTQEQVDDLTKQELIED
ncbi:hypothetical protein [Terracoccus sp. 273MFTsu3.1]|uniref:hypothetical protein n=1 Tax=Terracoccus sp. 273MFTsu3.1 TaxID=1172188 RepID=UPI0003AAA760|nr:hypothetical protein [Terracoccus sp. 273MFTsu3.1]